MKSVILSVFLSVGLVAPLLADSTNVLSDEKSKASYAIGMSIGHNFQQQNLDIDLNLVLRGMKDMQAGGATLLTVPEMQSTLKAFQQAIMAKQMKARQELAESNKVAGAAFLAANKNNPGVITLPDGLQYQILTTGTGAEPGGQRHCDGELSRHAAGRHGIRQLLQARPARDVPGRRRHSRLDRGARKNAGRFQVETVHPVRTGLRRAGAIAASRRTRR